ncbi:MAG: DUF4974 domain-containing protein [Bacteroidales bacterium]|nr:DUF4974 domain-containing protein [Bacteroidales bacterium]
MDSDRLYSLLDAYKMRSINKEEQKELLQALADPAYSETVKQWISDCWDKRNLPELLSIEQSEQIYGEIREKILPGIKKNRYYTFGRVIITTAAAIVAGIIITVFWINNEHKTLEENVAEVVKVIKDVPAPDMTKARITLADGKVLYLDSLENGKLSRQKGIDIIKLDDNSLKYKGSSAIVTYNTLTNPRGSDVVSITLADGTIVSLNADSYITYPTSFNSQERKVILSGEAYFDVAKNKDVPFIVNINNKFEVKVFGTEFNINAYKDESTIRTTLVEGSVQVSQNITNSKEHSFMLYPGQQASLSDEGIFSIQNVDISESISWKDGVFNFTDMNLESIMKNLSRWYDVDVEFKNSELKKLIFGGIISRRSNISTILKFLAMTETVNFEVNGSKIIVKEFLNEQ